MTLPPACRFSFSKCLHRISAIVGCSGIILTFSSLGSSPPEEPSLPNFDRRPSQTNDVFRPSVAQTEAAQALQRRRPGLRIDFDAATGAPRRILAPGAYLPGPTDESRTTSPQRADPLAATDPQRPIRAFLDEHRALFGHGAEALSLARVAREDVTRHNGLRTVVWQQTLDSLPVYEAILTGHIARDGHLVSLGSQFISDPAAATSLDAGQRTAMQTAPPVATRQAVHRAALELDPAAQFENVVAVELPAAAPDRRQRFKADTLPGWADARLLWFPLTRDSVRLAWQVELTRPQSGERYRVVVDAQTAEVLLRRCLTLYASDATYRVYTGESPTPMPLGWPAPSAAQPPPAPRQLITLIATDTNASPLGWINDGLNETRGNNVDAHLDRNADDLPDLPRPQGRPWRVFDFAMDPAQDPSTYGAAAVVQLFYWCNWMHDRLYALGFTEAAGNFQKDKFGRGGQDNDSLLADAQDGSGVNNANFTPSPDGESPRIQMYIFSGPDPARDGDFDAEVVLHEYTHGLTTRLVGGGVGISALQTGGMGEGWSDFFALALLTDPASDPAGAYPMGAYASRLFQGLNENYYFGIRRYPYSTDLQKNPLTFKDIDSGQISPHDPIPRSPIHRFNPIDAPEVHNAGEVWCVALWEVRANLIAKHGPAAGNELALQLVTDGLKLAPANPNFLEARDAIIQADLINNSGANFLALWSGFAKRGLGFNATSPASSTTDGVVESFALPDSLLVYPPYGLLTTGPVGGPYDPAAITYTLTNFTTHPLTWSLTSSADWLSLGATNGVLPGASATNITIRVNDLAGAFSHGIQMETLTFSNVTSGVAQTRPVELRAMGFTGMPFHEDFESGQIQPYWNISGHGTYRTQVTTASVPHAGQYHMTFDSSGINSPARNEATLGIDLGGYSNVVLRFWAKNIGDEPDGPPPLPFFDGADFDGVAISTDGVEWYEVVSFVDLPEPWTYIEVNLDEAMTSFGLTYNSTFRIRFNEFDNYSIPFDGIAIDDIELTGSPSRRLTLELPPIVTEGAGTLAGAGRVHLAVAPATDVAVRLSSSAPDRLAVPATVILRAGQTSATFDLLPVDNALLDGSELVRVTVSAPGYFGETQPVQVNDNERTSLRLRLPRQAREGDGVLAQGGTLRLGARPARDIAVQLQSSNENKLLVPATVVVPAGQTLVHFPLTIVDNTQLDGTLRVHVTAHVDGWRDGSAWIDVADNDVPVLRLILPGLVSEADGLLPDAGQVQLAASLAADLPVQLSSSNTNKLVVPARVTIPRGQLGVTFPVQTIDDAVALGLQTVLVTATASGYSNGVAAVGVLDDEVPPLPYRPDPPDFATDVGANVQLSWHAGIGEILVNGDFELGSLLGWSRESVGLGSWVINDGQFDPEGPEDAVPAQAGKYSAMTQQSGGGTNTLLQDIAIPRDSRSATLSWWQRVHNHGTEFQHPNQEFRVEIRSGRQLLATAFTTQPGDALLGDWEQHSFDLSRWRGLTVRVAFVQQDDLGYFNTAIDGVSVILGAAGAPVYDVYFGTNAAPGPADLLGSVRTPSLPPPHLAANTTYYWRVVTRLPTAESAGPVWRFTTRPIGAVDHFEWQLPDAALLAGEPFPVTLLAKDADNRTVPGYAGPVTLSGVPGSGRAPSIVIAEIDTGTHDRVKFANAFGRDLDVSGWQISLYDARSWPDPVRTVVLPERSLCPAGGVFGLGMLGIAPGTLPNFNSGTNIQWTPFAVNNPIAVLLQDRDGEIIDFACAADSDPSLIVKPVPIPAAEWIGLPLAFNTNLNLSYQRVGHSDHNSAEDWILAPLLPGQLPPTLQLPFLANANLAVTPSVATHFVDGVWSGNITVAQVISRGALRAEDDSGSFGVSAPFTIEARNNLSLALHSEPHLPLVGGWITNTFLITNSGPDDAPAVGFTNEPPANGIILSAAASQGSCQVNEGAVRCDLGALPGSTTATVQVILRAADVRTVTNRAAILLEKPDGYPADNELETQLLLLFPTIYGSLLNSVREGNEGLTDAAFTVRLSAPCLLPVSCHYATADGTGVAGQDYVATNGTLAFSPGATSAVAHVQLIANSLDQPTRLFLLRFSEPTNAVVGSSFILVRLLDDDPAPQAAITDAAVVEGDRGTTTNAVFQVTLSAPSAMNITINFTTTNGTASSGSDYQATAGILFFPPGVTNQEINVTVNGDRIYESNETFWVVLDQPMNVTLEKSAGLGTILDDDLGVLDHFTWGAMAPFQLTGAPFAATLSARDALERVVEGFNGRVTLQGYSDREEVPIGAGTNDWQYPLGTLFHDARSQILYLADELGGPGKLNGLSLFVTRVPGQTLGHWTLRLKHTAASSFVQPAWEADGWTTVYQRDENLMTEGWTAFPFDVPFEYDGSNHLMLDLSFNNESYTSDGLCRYSETASARALYFRTDSAFGDPRTWNGSSAPRPIVSHRVPNIRWIREYSVPVLPTEITNFVNGQWSGEITVTHAATNMVLRAGDLERHEGVSDPFDVDSAAPGPDGLPTAWKQRYFGNPNAPGSGPNDDPDGDGSTNAEELRARTDPTRSESVLRVNSISLRPAGVEIQFPSVPGRLYQMERTTDPGRAQWVPVPGSIAGTGGTVAGVDPAARPGNGGATYFYRVTLVQ